MRVFLAIESATYYFQNIFYKEFYFQILLSLYFTASDTSISVFWAQANNFRDDSMITFKHFTFI